MNYFVKNTLENLTLVRTISDSFFCTDAHKLFNEFKHHNTILLIIEEHPAPLFRFRNIPEALFISEAELREIVFTLSLEQ